MAYFMKLTIVDGREALINADAITRIEALGPYTRVTFDFENEVNVKESPTFILGGMPNDRISKP